MVFRHFLEQRKKKTEKKKHNQRIIKDRIIKDIMTLFKQEEDYYEPKRVSNIENYFEYIELHLNMKLMVN